MQKDFFHGTVATVAYVGNKGSRLPTLASVNQLPYAGAPYPFPNLPGVTIADRESIMSSNYNALQTSLQRRLKSGLAFNVNYTWAHALTNVGGIGEGNAQGSCVGPCHVDNGRGQATVYDSFYQYDYGNSDLDTRQRVSLTMTYDLPFGKNLTGAAAYAAKGWTLNSIYYAQTGIPITITSATNTSGLPVTERPNQGKPTPGFHRSLSEWYDVSQFRLPGVDLLGNAERNSIYGPGTQALGFSVFKYIPIHERVNLQFRAEAFNLFNTPTFS